MALDKEALKDFNQFLDKAVPGKDIEFFNSHVARLLAMAFKAGHASAVRINRMKSRTSPIDDRPTEPDLEDDKPTDPKIRLDEVDAEGHIIVKPSWLVPRP